MKRLIALLCLTLLLALLFTGAARALTSYDLSWWTVDGGGGSSSGTGYRLSGTIGQAEAGPVLSGSGYRLEGGFWAQVSPGGLLHPIYLPLVIR